MAADIGSPPAAARHGDRDVAHLDRDTLYAMLGLHRHWRVLASVSFALAAAAVVQAAFGAVIPMQPPQNTAPDVTKLGPQVGEKTPDFRLADQHGQMRTLASLMGPKGLVLVFTRSADW
jgi:cytochrome oxidase Cu insertion factor (SCO1/SenC/PrrC family)